MSLVWNGKPIEELDSEHIKRILAAEARGVWASGKPCTVGYFLANKLRDLLTLRGDKPDGPPPPTILMFPDPPPPDYSAQLAAMGYVPPPPPPAGAPAPWSPQVRTKLPIFPSIADEPMAAKGSRLVSKLEDENRTLQLEVDETLALLRTERRKAERLAREQREADRVNQPMAKRLEAMERRANSADLEDIDEVSLIAWWREEIEDCSGALVRGLNRLLSIATKGNDALRAIDAQSIQPRKPQPRRGPGIQRD